MGWEHTAREKRLAPIGEYCPEHYRITVHDSFQQYRLRMAALAIRNGMSIPEFFLFCADYVLAHHRHLRHFQSIFRKGARQITAAARSSVASSFTEPESEKERRRRQAFDRFCEWAGPELLKRREEGGR
jgi:hypothetical protein